MKSSIYRAGRPSYEELLALVAQQAARIAEQETVIARLSAENAELRLRMTDLEARLAQNSSNSSLCRRRHNEDYAEPGR